MARKTTIVTPIGLNSTAKARVLSYINEQARLRQNYDAVMDELPATASLDQCTTHLMAAMLNGRIK